MGQFVNAKTLLTSDILYILSFFFFEAQLPCALLKAGVVIILG